MDASEFEEIHRMNYAAILESLTDAVIRGGSSDWIDDPKEMTANIHALLEKVAYCSHTRERQNRKFSAAFAKQSLPWTLASVWSNTLKPQVEQSRFPLLWW